MSDQPIIPNNAEIDAALKEFEASKYNTEQSSQATVPPAIINPVVKTTESPKNDNEDDIGFDTDNFKAVSAQVTSAYEDKGTSGMVKLVMKLSGGAVKTERQAEWILLGVIVVAVGISLYLVFGVVTTPVRKKLSMQTWDNLLFHQNIKLT
jgi:hypothetical protein